MSEEIIIKSPSQILDKMRDFIQEPNEIKMYGISLFNYEVKQLLDYITNLEQAIKDTKESADDMLYELQQENEKLQEKIDKAIEYIKEHIRIDDEYPDYMEMLIKERDELLSILQNGSEENG